MRIGSLFTGYGGLDMAAEQYFSATTAWTCDIDAGASKIIQHHWPDIPNLHDITTVNWSDVEPVDILAGGWPCQPFSLAGKQKGAADERALWPYVAETVRALRPRWIVLENVAAITTAGELGRALSDLAALRYVGQWRCLRAADIGAPHGRARIFILATDTEHDGRNGAAVSRSISESETAGRMLQPERRNPAAADADLIGHQRSRNTRHRRGGSPHNSATSADANGDTVRQQPIRQPQRGSQTVTGSASADTPADTEGDTGRLSNRNNDATTDTNSGGFGRDGLRRDMGGTNGSGWATPTTGRSSIDWGPYEPAIRRWEHALGRLAPSPTERSPKGTQRLSPAFVEWMMGLPVGWVCDVPGLTRNAQLKALGNGVVPQQALAALELMA